MHYGGSKFDCAKFRSPLQPYMTLKPDGKFIQDNKNLSSLDIATLKRFYAPRLGDPSKSRRIEFSTNGNRNIAIISTFVNDQYACSTFLIVVSNF